MRSASGRRRLETAAIGRGSVMNIAEVSREAGLPAKTIRYYEEVGLIRPLRRPNGYRSFGPRDLRTLSFLGRARALGFSIEECRTLLRLYEDPGRSSAEVKALVEEHLRCIEWKMRELEEMKATLATLSESCAGDGRPDCPILRDLAGRSA